MAAFSCFVKQQGSRDPTAFFDCVIGWGSYLESLGEYPMIFVKVL